MKIKQEGDKVLAPKPMFAGAEGPNEEATVVDRLATQYFLQWEDGTCAFFFHSDKRLQDLGDKS